MAILQLRNNLRIVGALAVAGATAAAALILTPGTFGAFTASSSDTASVTAGSVSLTDSVSGPLSLTGAGLYTASNLQPGKNVSGSLTITNSGSLPTTLTLQITGVTSGFQPGDVQVSVVDENGNNIFSAYGLSNGTNSPTQPLPDGPGGAPTNWAAGHHHSYTITVGLPMSDGNADQGKSASFTLSWSSTQLTGGVWTQMASVPMARYAAAGVALGGSVYVAGGQNGTDQSSLQRYDASTDTWTTVAAMPGGRYGADGAQVLNGLIYVIGGWTTSPGLPHSDVFIYNPSANTWASGPSVPQLTACGSSGVINGKLYITTACDGFSGYRDGLMVLDPATNTWASLPAPPHIHTSPGGYGVINGKLYVAGGYDGTTWSTAVDAFDPVANAWTTKAAMPAVQAAGAGAVLGGHLYVFGGTNGSTALSIVQVYDPTTDTWSSDTSLPGATTSPVAGVVGNTIYVAGGANGSTILATNYARS